MIVAFDSKFLILFLDKDPKDGSEKKSKVQYLIKTLEEAKAKIIIPTPALAEAMTGESHSFTLSSGGFGNRIQWVGLQKSISPLSAFLTQP